MTATKRTKRLSRAARRDNAVSLLDSLKSDLETLVDEIEEALRKAEDGSSGQDRESYTDEQDRENYTVDEDAEEEIGISDDQMAMWKATYDTLSEGESEAKDALDELKGELSDWKDNIEEHFSHTEKYSTLESSVDTLDNACSTLDGLTWPTFPDSPDDLDTFVDELRDVTNDLSSAIDDAEAAEFPGMYG